MAEHEDGTLDVDEAALRALSADSASRFQLWGEFLRATRAESVAEIGVYRGRFAAEMLAVCDRLRTYYLIDPWRHLDDWHKPANASDDRFAGFLEETKANTAFAADKRIILRGTTTEVIDEIPDGSLDFAYIDGDHTLRGCTIDLIRVWPKVRAGGWIGGDDFTRTVWQHGDRFEPTMVFPYAVYFAEAMRARIFGLAHLQYLIHKPLNPESAFEFRDLTDSYPEPTLQSQFRLSRVMRGWFSDMVSLKVSAEKMPKNVTDAVHGRSRADRRSRRSQLD